MASSLKKEKTVEEMMDELLAKHRAKLDRDQRRIDELEEQNTYLVDTLTSSVVVPASAFGMSFVRAYYGESSSVFGIPIDAAVGLLLHGLAACFGFSGDKEAQTVAKVAHDVANGALASWSAATGAELGAKKRMEKSVPVPLPSMGAEKIHKFGPGPMTYADLAAIKASMGLPAPTPAPLLSPIPAQQQQMTGAVAPLQETPARAPRPMTHDDLAAINAAMALNTLSATPAPQPVPAPLPTHSPPPMPPQQKMSPIRNTEVAAAPAPMPVTPQHSPLNVPPPIVATATIESAAALSPSPNPPRRFRFTQRWEVNPEADMRALLQSVGAPSDPNTVMHLLSHENPSEAFNAIVRRARAPA